MTFCAWCGAELPPPDRFCSKCGRPVAGSYPPMPPSPAYGYLPPRPNHTVLLVVVVIVVFVGATVALSAILYAMTSGLQDGMGVVKPTVALSVSKTPTGADVLVAGIQPTAQPSNFKVNIEDDSSTTFGTAVAMPTTPGGSVSVTVGMGVAPTVFSVQWQNPGGSGLVSQGDHFVVAETSGAYSVGTIFTFLLIWSDGSTVTSINWQV